MRGYHRKIGSVGGRLLFHRKQLSFPEKPMPLHELISGI